LVKKKRGAGGEDITDLGKGVKKTKVYKPN